MKIGIANDHGGVIHKEKIKKYLKSKGHEIVNFGTDSKERVDYPEYAFKLCKALKDDEIELGIAICKSGIGMSISCNKVRGIRCAKINSIEDAKSAKEHNNVNVLAIGADMNMIDIKDMLDVFFKSSFLTDEVYQNRIDMISEYEAMRK